MIRVCGPNDPPPDGVKPIYTTSSVSGVTNRIWSRQLSPLLLGPCWLWGGFYSRTVENAWQYSKVYPCHKDNKWAWLKWATSGWDSHYTSLHHMTRKTKPVWFNWNGVRLGYLEARQKIYIPCYAQAAAASPAFFRLMYLHKESKEDVWLWDYHGYDHVAANMSLIDVIEDEKRQMSHNFVLALMLDAPEIMNYLYTYSQPKSRRLGR
jgi:hypothetical protein